MSLPDGVERDYPLARLTTVRDRRNRRLLRPPATRGELVELLPGRTAEGSPVEVVGSGSNLLVADDGVRGLVLKLAGELAGSSATATRIVCGGGARLPSAAAKAAGWGLAGLEFGINIPGTVGGAVRMNANAYGGELARVLEWVDVCTGAGTRAPRARGARLRLPPLQPAPGRGGRAGRLRADAAEPAAVKATLAEMRAKRREAQPSGIKTFGSTFKNPDRTPRAEGRTAGQLLAAAGCAGLAVGGARFSQSTPTSSRTPATATTADVLAVMAAGRRRVHERFGVELEPEVQVLGEV